MQAPPSLTETYAEFCARVAADGCGPPMSEAAWELVRHPITPRAMREACRNMRWATPRNVDEAA